MSTIDQLPEAVFCSVLARLPVKTLMQLRGVSKSWADVIDSSEFAKTHLDFLLANYKSHQKFIFESVTRGLIQSTSFKFLPGNLYSLLNSDSHEVLHRPEPMYDQGMKLVGSSRGLVCIRYVKEGAYLCNPWTRKYKKLPRTRSTLQIFPEGRIWMYTIYGFGYDNIHDDYKVVSLVGVRSKKNRKFCNEVKIYSLRSNKWKEFENLPDAPISRSANGVLHNHILHWILYTQKSILAIDLRTEERQFLLLPEDFSRRSLVDSTLGVESDGTLYLSMAGSLGFEIWLMKDYGIKESWIQLKVDIHGLDPYTASRVIRYSESEKQLIFSDNYKLTYWYDIEKETLLETKLYAVRNFFCTVESLVPLRSDGRGRRSQCRRTSFNQRIVQAR